MNSRIQKSRQFLAVLKKNFILQTRGRRSLLGISGWGALVLQVMLPVAFFSLMCIPKYYIQPYQHPLFIQSQEYDVDTKWWAGASPYEGPAYNAGGNARVIFVPDTPGVRSLVTRVAMAVSCPTEPYKRICSSSSITTFPCMFGVKQAPAECKDSKMCMQNPACYAAALSSHFRVLSSEGEAVQLLEEEPDSVDAVVVFPEATAAAGIANNMSAHGMHKQSSHASSNGDSQLLDYVIRLNSSDIPPTQLLQDMFDVSPGLMPLPGNLLWEYRRYWFFLNLQLVIDRALLGGQQSNSSYPANLSVKIKPFPWPARQEDLGAATAAAFFNLLLVYAFLAPTRAVVGSIVREKELRLREGMKILGLSESAYWCSWSLTHWLTLAASGLLCTLVGKYPFRHSSLLLMLCFYWLFSAALISFSYFLSTLFSTSRVAGTATQFIYALSMIPGFLLPFIRPYGGLSWYLASLLPTSAASLFAAALVNWERVAAGVQANTLWLPVTQGSGYCVGSVMWLLMMDVLLYGALTWYCDKVIPSSYGQTLPPWFVLQPSFWRSGQQTNSNRTSSRASSTARRRSRSSRQNADESMPLMSTAADGITAAVVSSTPAARELYVQTVNLRRVFRGVDGSSRVAVEGLNLKMYAGRITALLGHNGAGKTTTIHMLTGMLQPSSGTALIGGSDITVDMPLIRQSLGICPQFDILWPDLTVLEHLVLYAVIKGARGARAHEEARTAAAEVGLLDKLSSLASELSGGQRRKLSVAIAFLGSPAVVFLDEPTSGMDPFSRRATWEVIKTRRSSSVIVLTTHSMEEADLLCDDIHIMAEGRLVASGTPLTLKTQYGVGYTFTVVLKHNSAAIKSNGAVAGPTSEAAGAIVRSSNPATAAAAGSVQDGQVSSASAVESLMQLVLDHIPSAELLSAAGAEVSVRLPQDDSSAFAAVLRSLDAAASSLGITSYGLSVTTLEEVFLAIADQAVSVRHKPRHRRSISTSSNLSNKSGWGSWGGGQAATTAMQSGGKDGTTSLLPVCGSGGAGAAAVMLEGLPLCWQQFKALFVKRMLCARRDRLAVITQLLVPLLLVLLAMMVSTLETSHHQQPPLEFSRQTCLFGSPALLAAAPAVRQQVEFRGLMDGYSRSDIIDTQYTQLYHGSAGLPLNLTLEGQLLSQFFSGSSHYDGLHLQHMPPLDQLLTSLGDPPVMTLLVNQSAISGLPAALNQVTTALLRVLVAAGGGKGHSALGGWTPVTPVDISSAVGAAARHKTVSEVNLLDDSSLSLDTAAKHRALQSISIHNFSSSAAACDASSCSCLGQRRLPSCLPRIRVSSSPLPLLPGEGAERVREDAGALMLVLCMTLAGSVLTASFVVYLVREQENNSKHLQLVSGASPTAYWLANYCWDLLNFSLPAVGVVLLVWAYKQPQLTGIRLAAMAVLLWVFGAAGINLTYLCHFVFKDEMKALQRLNTAYFLVGYLGFTTTWVLSLIARVMAKPALSAATAQVKGVLRVLSPHYCFAQGLYDITNTYPGAGGLPVPGLEPEGPHNPFTYSVLGTAVVHLLGQSVVFGAAAVLYDVGLMQLMRSAWQWVSCHTSGAAQQQPVRQQRGQGAECDLCDQQNGGSENQQHLQQQFCRPLTAINEGQWSTAGRFGVGMSQVNRISEVSSHVLLSAEDDDVAAERVAVQAGVGLNDAMVVLNGISKTYHQGYGLPDVKAVTGLWLRIKPGECFGLLGVNGAGKTTTFKVLTGEMPPDTGDAVIATHSVLTQLSTARRNLGYCPQFDALPSAMTGREVLHMYARLRGVGSEERVQQMADQLLDELGLLDYAESVCGAYSGGNKRKLNVAVALVGCPPLVLLDEPSTGMDPSARRFLWRVLQSEVLCTGRTILLTSHSMEEVDALASRLVIMAAGAATCLGTPQHLKSKFGDGYTLELRITSTAADRAQHQLITSLGESETAAQAGDQQVAGSLVEAVAAATAAAEQHFMTLMPGATVLEREPGRLLLRLPISTTVVSSDSNDNNRSSSTASRTDAQHTVRSLADVFECVESCKQQLGIAEYSLSQSSLERVFLALAKAASHAADGRS